MGKVNTNLASSTKQTQSVDTFFKTLTKLASSSEYLLAKLARGFIFLLAKPT
jgi:hypothetical protein